MKFNWSNAGDKGGELWIEFAYELAGDRGCDEESLKKSAMVELSNMSSDNGSPLPESIENDFRSSSFVRLKSRNSSIRR